MLTFKEAIHKITQGNFAFVDKDGNNLLQILIKNEELASIPLAPVQQLLKKCPELANTPDKHGLYPLQILENAQVKARKNRSIDDDEPGVASNRPLRRLLYQYTTNPEQKKLLAKSVFISFIEQINGTRNKEEKDALPIEDRDVKEKLKHPCLLIFPGLEGSNTMMVKSTGRIIRKALGIYNHKTNGFSILAVRCPGNEKDFANDYQLYHKTLPPEKWHEKIEDFIIPFVQTYLRPCYLNEQGEKLPLKTILKNVRKINFMGYCRGAYIIQEIADYMNRDMLKRGFTEEEAKKIQSQMLCFDIGSDLTKYRYKTNMRTYHWVHALDNVVGQNVSQIFEDLPLNGKDFLLIPLPHQENQQILFVNTLENNTSYEPHTLNTYFNPANATQKQALTWMRNIVFNGLNNAIENEKSDTFIPLGKNLQEAPEKILFMENATQGFYVSSKISRISQKQPIKQR